MNTTTRIAICSFIFFAFSASATAQCSIGYLRWPLSGAPNWSNISQDFGDYNSSFTCGGYSKRHTAIDYPAPHGSTVYAAAYGTVKEAYTDANEVGVVVMEHSSGCYTTVYWHLVPTVSAGTTVYAGQQIGYLGTPSYTGSHLHFGIRSTSYSWLSKPGYLPQTSCGGYPSFSEYFEDPLSFSYYW